MKLNQRYIVQLGWEKVIDTDFPGIHRMKPVFGFDIMATSESNAELCMMIAYDNDPDCELIELIESSADKIFNFDNSFHWN